MQCGLLSSPLQSHHTLSYLYYDSRLFFHWQVSSQKQVSLVPLICAVLSYPLPSNLVSLSQAHSPLQVSYLQLNFKQWYFVFHIVSVLCT